VPKPPYRPITDLYDYRSAKGELLYQVVRHEGKAFSQRQLQGMRAVWSLNGIEPVLYRLPELLRATAVGKRIYVAEGEKDVETLREAGVAATCNPGGAGKWREEYSEILRGAAVYVVADLDRAGAKHSRAVAESLRAHGCAVGIVQPKSGKDATDHFAAGYAVNDFEEFTWEPPPDENPETPEEDSTGGNDDESDSNEDADLFEREVQQAVRRERIKQEANRRIRVGSWEPPEFSPTLKEELDANDVHSQLFTT